MNTFSNDVAQDVMSNELDSYWLGFELVAFALYDKNFVYLFKHPKMVKEANKNYQILKRDDQFVGCTLILYQDYPTAIVDLELYQDEASLYSILIHELFHGFQYLKGENRFPNEVMGVTYPLSKQNIELRSQERLSLYRAVLEKDRTKKEKYLAAFISLREKRTLIFDEYLEYEKRTETIEGPAWYVELKSFFEKGQQEYDLLLKKYGQQLIDHYDSTLYIRRSCYSSGLFMCLLLDELAPDWKRSFWDKEKTVYDLLKEVFNAPVEIDEFQLNLETEKVINYVLEHRKELINRFEQQRGINVFIEGNITVKSFDPMNMTLFEDKVVHKHFIKVEINDTDYLVQQPVIAYCKGDLRNIIKLHLILKEKPVENMNSLTIEGLGVVNGKYKKGKNALHLKVN